MIGPRATLRLLSPARSRLVVYALAAIGRSALTVVVVLLVRDFLAVSLQGGAVLPGLGQLSASQALLVTGSLLLASHLGAAACGYLSLVTEQKVVRRVELELLERVVRHLLSLSAGFFDRRSHGDLVQSVRRDVARVRMLALATISLALEGIQATGLIVAAALLSPLTLGVLLVFLLAGLPVYLIARRTLAQSRQLRMTSARLYDTVLQMLRGARLIKIYRGVDSEADQAIAHARAHFDRQVEMARLRARAQAVLDSFSGLALVLVVVAGGAQVAAGGLEWPALIAFLAAVGAMQKPLGNIGSKLVTLQEYDASYRRIEELLGERSDVPETATPVAMPTPPIKLTFDDVTFAYHDKTVLDAVSFAIDPGETLVVVGPSGAGKTTLLGLIARFHDPRRGTVRLNGIDLRQMKLAEVHASVAIVMQDPLLFNTTVADNIRCGRPEAGDEEVRHAAVLAGVHEEVLGLPEGYQTEVGIGERRLSAGQEQRICIARALLRRAPFLLLDEATSGLDVRSEGLVREAVRNRPAGTTAIVVTHRPAMLEIADRVLVLEAGRVAALGDPGALALGNDFYRDLSVDLAGGAPVNESVGTEDLSF